MAHDFPTCGVAAFPAGLGDGLRPVGYAGTFVTGRSRDGDRVGDIGGTKTHRAVLREPASMSVVGQVQVLEGGAYLIRDAQGQEIHIPHDENTRIDRPAHVGDRIQS